MKLNTIGSSWLMACIIALMASCSGGEQKKQDEQPPVPLEELVEIQSGLAFPTWTKNAVIYEVNLRQYSEKGDFAGFEAHLPRLQKLGVDILWFMPLHPIGIENRKGGLGSYYSVLDYQKVNPEFGTMEDFKALVAKCHEMGFKVMIDWVANHTSWDNHLTKDHPDWYYHDSTGAFKPPVADWSDVIQLDFSKPGLRQYMTESLIYWVEEADIDGFRCDVASMVPTDYWEEARAALDEVKPLFMLAEAEKGELHNKAFHMCYSWECHHHINQIGQSKEVALDLDTCFTRIDTVFPPHVYRLNFTSNHDENTWNGTVEERLGDAAKAMAVLTYTLEGMPLIYGGQEAGLNKRLAFFEKDLIDWKESPWTDFYSQLNTLKKENEALWNGQWGGNMERIPTPNSPDVYAFKRMKGGNTVLVILNLSAKEEMVSDTMPGVESLEKDALSGENIMFNAGDNGMLMAPWAYHIVVTNSED